MAEASWWMFEVPGAGVHQLRGKRIGTHEQEIFIDGAPLEAPPGTTTFTGPAGTLLELRQSGEGWHLYVEGELASPYDPTGGIPTPTAVAAEPVPVAWWKFALEGESGFHQVRVRNLGGADQEVFVDGAPLAAPPGTMTFTGPRGVLLELQMGVYGDWVLTVDGHPAMRFDPESDGAGTAAASTAGGEAVFGFLSSDGALHELRVTQVPNVGEQVFIDGEHVPAPPGQSAFTGPGGLLLELRDEHGQRHLFLDGLTLSDHNAAMGAITTPERSSCPGGLVISSTPAARTAVSTEALLPQGVSFCSESGKYTAMLKVGGRFQNLGDFSTPEEAAARYQQAKQQ